MDLIYSMRRKPLKCEPPHFESPSDHDVIRPICTISSANIIAFSSPTELTDSEGDTWGGHVYVCDMDTPWDSHEVTSTSYPVSSLEWDLEGKQLLVATTVGDVSIFTQKDFLLNDWTCLYTANFSGEHIISSIFFHNGRRIVAVEKKPEAPITERIQLAKPAPTLKGFGGTALEGALVITATGLIGALTPPASSETNRAQVATECLRPTRDHITSASIAYKNGKLIIAAVCMSGGLRTRWCVRCVTAAPAAAPPAPAHALHVAPLPTIYPPQQDMSNTVTISWWNREEPDSLLIAGATLSLWKCTERSHQVHKLFSKGPLQGSTTPGGGTKPGAECFNTLVWQKSMAWPIESGSIAMAVSSVRAPLPSIASHAVLATHNALHLVAKDNLHYLCSRTVTNGGVGSSLTEASTPPKKPKYGTGVNQCGTTSVLSSVEISPWGSVVVAIDAQAQLHLYKLPQPAHELPTPLAVQHATNILEYSLVSGIDCLDLLITLKHSLVEAIYERLTESFQRQPAAFQQYYFHSWLKLRIALCRLLPSGQSSASWLTCLSSLHASWSCVTSWLRTDDKPDAAPLAALLDEHAHEHDKALLTLEAKSDTISEVAALAPLRLILQRALDIALTALLSMCHHQQHQHMIHHSYSLWADPSAVQLLRKLCCVARLAGRPADLLIRPLARLAASNVNKPDLIEECASLMSAWSETRVWEALPRCSISAPHGYTWPVYLEYGVEPEWLRHAPEPPPYAQSDTAPSTTMDAIRHTHLGGGSRPARWRACGRCGARALPSTATVSAVTHTQTNTQALTHRHTHNAQRASDARFAQCCRCGGKWTLFSNI